MCSEHDVKSVLATNFNVIVHSHAYRAKPSLLSDAEDIIDKKQPEKGRNKHHRQARGLMSNSLTPFAFPSPVTLQLLLQLLLHFDDVIIFVSTFELVRCASSLALVWHRWHSTLVHDVHASHSSTIHHVC